MKEESWQLTWFPPDVEQKTRTFKSRDAVDRFLKKQEDDYTLDYPAGNWNPMLTHIVKTVEETVVPL